MEKQNTITGYINFFSIQIYSVLQILTMKREKMYMESLEKEDISEKYKVELMSLFDRLKIENMPDVYSQGNPFSVEQEFF